MKKIFLILFCFLFLTFGVAHADLVPCGQGDPTAPGWHRCELSDLSVLALNIYDFIVEISTALAGVAMVVGGVVLLASAGNPGMASSAKRVMFGTVIGIVLVWTSWIIIHTVLGVIGYTGPI